MQSKARLVLISVGVLLLFSWPPVCEVCPNYEVVTFQLWTGNPLDLGYVADFYIDILI